MVAQPEEREWLRDLLREARPNWKPKDLAAVEEKLCRVGADDVTELGRLLERGLNKRLRDFNQKTFSDETITALHARYCAAFPHLDQTLAIEDAPALHGEPPAPEERPGLVELQVSEHGLAEGGTALRSSEEVGAGDAEEEAGALAARDWVAEDPGDLPSLGDVLREARPSWTPGDLEDIERKLSRVDVCSTVQLGALLNNGLNGMLKRAGYKTLSRESVVALQARFSKADLCAYLRPFGRHERAGGPPAEAAAPPAEAAAAPAEAAAAPAEAAARPAWVLKMQSALAGAGLSLGQSQEEEEGRAGQAAVEGAGRRRKQEPRWLQKAKQHVSTGAKHDPDSKWTVDSNLKRILQRASEKAGFVPSNLGDQKVTTADLEAESRAAEADRMRVMEQERLAQSERLDESPLERKRWQQRLRAAALQENLAAAEAPAPEAGDDAARSEEPAPEGAENGAAPEMRGETEESAADADASLPEEACAWTAAERKLFYASKGLFAPGVAASKRRSPEHSSVRSRVTIAVPTVEARQDYHEQLWEVFNEQTWPDKELVVVETYTGSPSAFFTAKQREDRRIVFLPIKVAHNAADLSIGVKRNICTYLASGFHIANFDDDDLYAPCYIATMLEALLERGSSLATLASWYVFDSQAQEFGHLDPFHLFDSKRIPPEQAAAWIFGYGFSYVYTRELAIANPYPPVSYQEDTIFYRSAQARINRGGVPPRMLDPGGTALVDDAHGICLHTLHRSSTSSTEEDAWAFNKVSAAEVRSLEVNGLDAILRRYRSRFRTRGVSHFIQGPPRRRTRQLKVASAKQELTIDVPVGATFGDVRRELQRRLEEEPVELYHSHQQDDGEQRSLAFPLRDSEFVGIHCEGLWAVLVQDRPVVVTVVDMPDYARQVQVSLQNSRLQVDDLRRALLQQHGTDAEVSRIARSKVRLARVSPSGKFFEADAALEVGQARVFFATGLADLLGRPKSEHTYQSDELERLQLQMYGTLPGAVPAAGPLALTDRG